MIVAKTRGILSGQLRGRGISGKCAPLARGTGDQARALAVAEVGPDPLEEDGGPAAESDEENEVDEHPCQPGGEPSEFQVSDLAHCGVAADGRHAPLVEIVPRERRFALQLAEDVFCGMAAGLHGGGAQAGDRSAPIERGGDHVPDGVDLGMPGDGEIGVGFNAPLAIDLAPEHRG